MKRIIHLWALLYSASLIAQPSDQLHLIGQASIPHPATDLWVYVDEVTDTEYAIVGSDFFELFFFDVSDPTQPILVHNEPGVAAFDIKSYQQYVYSVTGTAGGEGSIFDLSDPANPVEVANFPSAHNIWISEEGLLIAECNGMKIYDLPADPLNPTLLFDDQTFGCHDALIVDTLLYDFHGFDGTNIYSIADPSNPELLGLIDDFSITFAGWLRCCLGKCQKPNGKYVSD